MSQTLYIDSSKPASQALVKSQTFPTAVNPPDFVNGDKIDQILYIANGAGGYDDDSGNPAFGCTVGIGPIEGGSSWATRVMTATTVGTVGTWQGNLDLTAATVAAAISGLKSIRCLYEVQITDASSNPQTYVQQEATLYNSVIS